MSSTPDLEHYNVRRGNQDRRRGESEAYFDRYGLRRAELRITLAAMAHYRCYGIPPMRQDIDSIGVKTETAALAIRARYLEETPCRALRPTKKAWHELRFWSTLRDDERALLEAAAR